MPYRSTTTFSGRSMAGARSLWLSLAAATFVILVLGYGTGFWG